jgi:pimeloyl-ACP methyl ester carboxylesterase
MRPLLLLLILLLSAGSAQARVVVLIHGYLGSHLSWHGAGIVQQLQTDGWVQRGNYSFSAQGALYQGQVRSGNPATSLYTVDLPSQSPIILQADWLATYLREISKNHPREPVSLIGHSAGGVVARLMLVRNGVGNVDQLITVAAPHLGTERAVQALSATSGGGMFGWAKQWLVRRQTGDALYSTVQASRGVLVDLTPAGQPGSLLYWLNRQPHPAIAYASVVRTAAFNMRGDSLVPTFSQDMNNVAALRGRSSVTATSIGHQLVPADAAVLSTLLKK